MFRRIEIPCLETLDELKEKCREKNIRIVQYNCDQLYEKLGIKRTRDIENEKEKQIIKRQRADEEENDQDDEISGALANVTARHQNEVRNDKSKIKDKLMNSKLQIIHNVSQVNDRILNVQQENRIVEEVPVERERVGYFFKDCNSKDARENLKKIIRSLDNHKEIEMQIRFYERIAEMEKNLNRELVRTNNMPITIRNNVDFEVPPLFRFIDEYNIDLLDEESLNEIGNFVQKCTCKNNCKINSPQSIQTCCFSYYGDEIFYDSKGCITNYSRKRGPIVECTKECACGEKCHNRVVQRGIKVRLQIFKTSDGRGWGLKAMEKIPSNRFITTYRGQVISGEEANIRQTASQNKDTYFFDLDFNESLLVNFVVDATYLSNLGRYLNHSCVPNCETFITYIENVFLPLPVIAFFSNREIKVNEELTIDYYMGAKNPPKNLKTSTVCLCKSAGCRKYIF